MSTSTSESPSTQPQLVRPGVDLTCGDVLRARYRLDKVIGVGGTATVFQATDLMMNRNVAVKAFSTVVIDEAAPVRQRLEAQALAGLNHPNLIVIFDAYLPGDGQGEKSDLVKPADPSYLVMELVVGQALSRELRDGPLSPSGVRMLGVALASALACVHANGLVHRDVKPANILLDETGAIKLSDFGIARLLNADHLTVADNLLGTAAYLSPEQARGKTVGPPSDIYSLGLVLLEALTGIKEFPGTAIEAAVARLLRDPEIPANLPQPWPTLLTSMTAANAEDRPTAAEVNAALSVPLAAIDNLRGALTLIPSSHYATRDWVQSDQTQQIRVKPNPMPDRLPPVEVFDVPTDVPTTETTHRKARPALLLGAAIAAIAAVIAITLILGSSPSGPAENPASTEPTNQSNPATSFRISSEPEVPPVITLTEIVQVAETPVVQVDLTAPAAVGEVQNPAPPETIMQATSVPISEVVNPPADVVTTLQPEQNIPTEVLTTASTTTQAGNGKTGKDADKDKGKKDKGKKDKGNK